MYVARFDKNAYDKSRPAQPGVKNILARLRNFAFSKRELTEYQSDHGQCFTSVVFSVLYTYWEQHNRL